MKRFKHPLNKILEQSILIFIFYYFKKSSADTKLDIEYHPSSI